MVSYNLYYLNLHERKGTSKSNWDAQIKRIEIEFNTKGGNDWNKYFHFVIKRVSPFTIWVHLYDLYYSSHTI